MAGKYALAVTKILGLSSGACFEGRDPTRIYKTEMKFWAVLDSRGCREKKVPTAIRGHP
jgi:hypothetical protein